MGGTENPRTHDVCGTLSAERALVFHEMLSAGFFGVEFLSGYTYYGS